MIPSVLYVDDDKANLTVFRAGCGTQFPVLVASSGAEALEIMAREPVAVLLTDQRMPGMTGAELAGIVREKYPDTVRYLITAYSDLEAAVDAINRGHIRRYLRKPWNVDELKAVLEEGLAYFSMQQKIRVLETRIRDMERVYALGVVSAGIAHELRNPMTIVIGNLDLAKIKLEQLAEDTDSSKFAKLDECVSHAQEAAHDMIEIMRGIELQSKRSVSEVTTSIAEVVRLTVKILAGEKHKRRTEIDVELDAVGEVHGSRTQLGQVVLNVLINALEAMSDKQDAGEPNKITVRLGADGERVRLEIADNGPGMTADVREHIFDPFYTTKENGGTGLGLAISKKIIEDTGGEMLVSSKTGSGTTFTILLRRGGDAAT